MVFIKGMTGVFKGRKHTLEAKEKVSKSLIGNKRALGNKLVFTEEHKRKIGLAKMGDKNPMKVKEFRDKMAKSRKGQFCGDEHPNWQGGKSFEEYGKEFNKSVRDFVRNRDRYRCQECFKHENELYYKNGKKYNLHLHHIDYDKKNNKPENLIALCGSCHSQTNFKRDDWIKYFKKQVG
jgi:hypothetical protein